MTELTIGDLGYKRLIISNHAGKMAYERDCYLDKNTVNRAQVVSRSTVEKSRMKAPKLHLFAVMDYQYWLIFKKSAPNTIVLKTVIPLTYQDKELLELA